MRFSLLKKTFPSIPSYTKVLLFFSFYGLPPALFCLFFKKASMKTLGNARRHSVARNSAYSLPEALPLNLYFPLRLYAYSSCCALSGNKGSAESQRNAVRAISNVSLFWDSIEVLRLTSLDRGKLREKFNNGNLSRPALPLLFAALRKFIWIKLYYQL